MRREGFIRARAPGRPWRPAASAGSRFAALVALLIVVGGTLVSGAVGYIQYRRESEHSVERIEIVLRQNEAALAAGLWDLDFAKVEAILSSLAGLADFDDVRVLPNDRLKEFWRGTLQRGRADGKTGDAEVEIVHPIAMGSIGSQRRLGTITVHSRLATARREAWQSTWYAVTVVVGVAVATGLAVLLIFELLVGRRLRHLARELKRQDGRTDLHIAFPGRLLRGDEFDRIADAFNGLGAEIATARRQEAAALAALTAHKEELERRVEERTSSLMRARDDLVQSEKMAALGGLVAGVAHEINTPIGIALTAASTLAEETCGLAEAMARREAKRTQVERYLALAGETSSLLLANCNRAAELIRSFKLVAVDQTSDERRVLRLVDYMNEILRSLQPKLKKLAVTTRIEAEAELVVNSYPGAIGQIVTNLVMNSLAHAFEGRTAGTIVLRAHAVDEATIELVHADDGWGIPAEIRTKIFDPFFTTRRGRGGSGLGLHIVHNLVVQRLGGRLHCEDTPGGGATFVIQLPFDAPWAS